jgi:riboflavin kinase/FMN adenylyltransferase
MPDACCNGVLTIGNFDGVHVGHQALLTVAAAQARTRGVNAVAVTFEPHPIQLLRPSLVEPFLTTLEDRAALLQHYGADHVLILQTTMPLLQLSAREFFEQIIVRQFHASALVEGFNFAFGRNREGTIEILQDLSVEQKVGLKLVPPLEVRGRIASSSRVRKELLAGCVDIACELLGRPYRISGIVGTGQKRGATLGFPTANLHDIATLIPGNGVYAVHANLDGQSWPAAANVGPNPTFGENARKVEVHLIGFAGSIYDKKLTVDFVKKTRDTKPFANAGELVAQIHADVERARKILTV